MRQGRRVAFILALVALVGARDDVAAATRAATATDAQKRSAFLTMFARGYYPGRSGQLFVVPREGHFVSQEDTALYFFMHGSPWDYDTRLPLLFFGTRHVRKGPYEGPACQQDIVPTLAQVLGLHLLPPTITGRALPIWRQVAAPPAIVMVLVLDGMRADYLERRQLLPRLAALRDSGAFFPRARINYLPTNTAVGHATIATGSDPRFHGIVGNSMYDIVEDTLRPPFTDCSPSDLLVPTLGDLWNAATEGRAHILAQGGNVKAGTALAGHGRGFGGEFFPGKRTENPVWLAAYDENTGRWTAGTSGAFTLSPGFPGRDSCWMEVPGGPPWLPKTPKNVRHSPLFARCEGKVALAAIDGLPLGVDGIPDLVLINLKTLDLVGHTYGPNSPQMDTALREVDTQVDHLVEAVRRKAGDNFVFVMTADHGMPPGDRRFARDLRHSTDAILHLLNAGCTKESEPAAFYEGEDAQIFLHRGQSRATIDRLAGVLRDSCFAVFTADSVRSAAARLH